MRRRRRVLAPGFGLLLVLGAALVGPWLWAEQRLSVGLARWTERAQAAGWVVRHGAPRREGWPLEAALELPGLEVSGSLAALPGGVAWSAPALRLAVPLLTPGKLLLQPEGTQALRVGTLPALAVTAEALAVALPVEGGARLEARGLMVRPAGLAAWRVGGARARISPGPGDAPLRFQAALADLVLPGMTASSLGDAVASVEAEGVLRGALPPAEARSVAAALLAWRDGGGAVVVDRLRLRWGALDVSGEGVLRLDEVLRPAGRASLTVVGWAAALEALQAAGVLGSGAELAAHAVLGLLARTPAGGGPSVVTLPVTLAEGTLGIGHIPLLRLPAPQWPGMP